MKNQPQCHKLVAMGLIAAQTVLGFPPLSPHSASPLQGERMKVRGSFASSALRSSVEGVQSGLEEALRTEKGKPGQPQISRREFLQAGLVALGGGLVGGFLPGRIKAQLQPMRIPEEIQKQLLDRLYQADRRPLPDWQMGDEISSRRVVKEILEDWANFNEKVIRLFSRKDLSPAAVAAEYQRFHEEFFNKLQRRIGDPERLDYSQENFNRLVLEKLDDFLAERGIVLIVSPPLRVASPDGKTVAIGYHGPLFLRIVRKPESATVPVLQGKSRSFPVITIQPFSRAGEGPDTEAFSRRGTIFLREGMEKRLLEVEKGVREEYRESVESLAKLSAWDWVSRREDSVGFPLARRFSLLKLLNEPADEREKVEGIRRVYIHQTAQSLADMEDSDPGIAQLRRKVMGNDPEAAHRSEFRGRVNALREDAAQSQLMISLWRTIPLPTGVGEKGVGPQRREFLKEAEERFLGEMAKVIQAEKDPKAHYGMELRNENESKVKFPNQIWMQMSELVDPAHPDRLKRLRSEMSKPKEGPSAGLEERSIWYYHEEGKAPNQELISFERWRLNGYLEPITPHEAAALQAFVYRDPKRLPTSSVASFGGEFTFDEVVTFLNTPYYFQKVIGRFDRDEISQTALGFFQTEVLGGENQEWAPTFKTLLLKALKKRSADTPPVGLYRIGDRLFQKVLPGGTLQLPLTPEGFIFSFGGKKLYRFELFKEKRLPLEKWPFEVVDDETKEMLYRSSLWEDKGEDDGHRVSIGRDPRDQPALRFPKKSGEWGISRRHAELARLTSGIFGPGIPVLEIRDGYHGWPSKNGTFVARLPTAGLEEGKSEEGNSALEQEEKASIFLQGSDMAMLDSAKSRLPILNLPRWRKAFPSGSLAYLEKRSHRGNPCLWMYPVPVFKGMVEQQRKELSTLEPEEAGGRLRDFLIKFSKVGVGSQGRITLSPVLRDWIGVKPGEEVLEIGVRSHLELWNPKTFMSRPSQRSPMGFKAPPPSSTTGLEEGSVDPRSSSVASHRGIPERWETVRVPAQGGKVLPPDPTKVYFERGLLPSGLEEALVRQGAELLSREIFEQLTTPFQEPTPGMLPILVIVNPDTAETLKDLVSWKTLLVIVAVVPGAVLESTPTSPFLAQLLDLLHQAEMLQSLVFVRIEEAVGLEEQGLSLLLTRA